jgi:hypothetical protein
MGETRSIAGLVPGLASALTLLPFLAACSGGPALPGLPTGSIAVGLPAGLPTLPSVGAAGELSQLPHPSAEVYARIARGANRCWFGGQGRIAKTHLLHADADPSAKGGRVDMVVHERAVDQPKPWGYKAFRVVITESAGLGDASGSTSSIEVENTRFADAEARRMRAEVFQWASGDEGCKADPTLDKPAEVAAPTAVAPVKAKAGKARPRSAAAGVPAAAADRK